MAEQIGGSKAATQLGLQESQLYGWRTKASAAPNRSEVEQRQAIEIAHLKSQLAEQA